jgi:hypothetical protein
MSYLQLAEDPYSHLAQNIPVEARDMYVYVPAGYKGAPKDLYIREDLLDNVPEMVYKKMMFELEPYQNTGMSAKEDRQARKEARQQRKALRGETRDARQQARLERAKSGETGLKTLLTGAQNIVSGIFGTGATDTTGQDRAFEGSIQFGTPEESPMSKYRVPLIIGGVAVAGFLVYKMMKKK